MSENSIRLAQCSHDAGYGCKTSPKVLETILHSEQAKLADPNLLVGNETRDDVAVYDLGNGTSVISTTDFFMSVVDNPFDFDHTAATGAISDIFAMGGKPIVAIVVLGWPISKPSSEIAREITEGGHYAYRQAGTALAGGRSIDAPELIFGLVVAEIVPTEQVKKSNIAQAGYRLFPTKPLGTGVLTTAEKKPLLKPKHQGLAMGVICRVNIAGVSFTNIEDVKAITDATGFGPLGYLSEMYQDAGVQVRADYDAVLKSPGVEEYIKLGAVSGDTERNFASYGRLMGRMLREMRDLLYDPQTLGGLPLVVIPEAGSEVKATAAEFGIELTATDKLVPACGGRAMAGIR